MLFAANCLVIKTCLWIAGISISPVQRRIMVISFTLIEIYYFENAQNNKLSCFLFFLNGEGPERQLLKCSGIQNTVCVCGGEGWWVERPLLQ